MRTIFLAMISLFIFTSAQAAPTKKETIDWIVGKMNNLLNNDARHNDSFGGARIILKNFSIEGCYILYSHNSFSNRGATRSLYSYKMNIGDYKSVDLLHYGRSIGAWTGLLINSNAKYVEFTVDSWSNNDTRHIGKSTGFKDHIETTHFMYINESNILERLNKAFLHLKQLKKNECRGKKETF